MITFSPKILTSRWRLSGAFSRLIRIMQPATEAPAPLQPQLPSARYVLGIHGPDTALVGDKEVRAYKEGDLDRYLELMGLTSGQGAIAHVKIRDEAGLWQRGRAPAVAPSVRAFLEEATERDFRTLVAYVPHGAWEPEPFGTPLPAQRDRLRDAGRQLAARLGQSAQAFLAWNELEFLLGQGATDRDWVGAWTAEAILGAVWREAGKAWVAGADASVQHLVSTIRARQEAWKLVPGAGRPDALAGHMYCEGGDQPEHLAPLMQALTLQLGWKPQLIISEWAIGFEGANVERGSKAYVRDAQAGHYAASFAQQLEALGISGCYFTMRELLEPAQGEELQRLGMMPAAYGLRTVLHGTLRRPVEAPILNPRKAMYGGMRLEAMAREVA